jgi:hypothetical protein
MELWPSDRRSSPDRSSATHSVIRSRSGCAAFRASFAPDSTKDDPPSQNNESLQADSTEDFVSFPTDRRLRRRFEAAGSQPASPKHASRLIQMAYNTRNGGGGNCTRSPRSASHYAESQLRRRPSLLSAYCLHRFALARAGRKLAPPDARCQGEDRGGGAA